MEEEKTQNHNNTQNICNPSIDTNSRSSYFSSWWSQSILVQKTSQTQDNEHAAVIVKNTTTDATVVADVDNIIILDETYIDQEQIVVKKEKELKYSLDTNAIVPTIVLDDSDSTSTSINSSIIAGPLSSTTTADDSMSTSTSLSTSSTSSELSQRTSLFEQTSENNNNKNNTNVYLLSFCNTIQQIVQTWPKEIRNILAGGIAGIIAKSIVAPIDRIKILFQVSNEKFTFTKLPKVFTNIISNEGISALWKGNTATLIRVFPYSGVQFMVFDRIKVSILTNKQQQQQTQTQMSTTSTQTSTTTTKNNRISKNFGLTPIESLYAGMIAGAVSVLCTYPLDLTRAQLAVLKKNKHGPNKGFISILYDNYTIGNAGIVGLFRGIVPTLIGILPYSGIAFALNEQAKREIQYVTGRDLTTMERMECGAFAGLLAQSVAYPVEVVRRRIQTAGIIQSSAIDTALGEVQVSCTTSSIGGGNAGVSTPALGATTSSSGSSSTTSNIVKPPTSTSQLKTTIYKPSIQQTVSDLYKEQGIRGFYKGVSMNWLKGPVAFSISFTMFDIVQSSMESPAEKVIRTPRRLSTKIRRQQPEQRE